MEKDIKQGIALYRDFRGDRPEFIDEVEIEIPKVAFVVGYCDGVMYTTVRSGKKESYVHKFRAAARPLLAAASDGSQLLLLGGSYNFTDRGIVDVTKSRRRR